MSRFYVFAIFTLLWTGIAVSAVAQSEPVLSAKEYLQSQAQSSLLGTLARATATSSAQLTSIRVREWDSEKWVDDSRTLFSYEGERRTARVTQMWAGDEYVNNWRSTYQYDSAGRMSMTTDYYWDASAGEFQPEARQQFQYVGAETIASEITGLEWDVDANDYVPVTRDTYTVQLMDGRYVITGSVSYEWSDGAWMAMDRFSLQQAGPDVVYTSEVMSGNSWVYEYRTIYSETTPADLYDRFAGLVSDLEEAEETMMLLVRLPDGLTQEWTGTDWEDASRQVTTFLHDSMTGAVAQSATLFEVMEEGEWETQMRIDLEYELVGLGSRPEILAIRLPLDDEGNYLDYYREVYAYHTSGHVSNVEIHSMSWLGEMEPRTWIAYDWSGISTALDPVETAGSFTLEAAYPNPFNPSTAIPFVLDRAAKVRITIYDGLGREVATVADGTYQTGRHVERFDAANLPSGTYFVKLAVDGQALSRAVTLLK